MKTILLLSFLVAATSAARIDLKKDNKTCIFALVDTTFHIPYMKDDNTTGIANVPLEGGIKVTGKCSNGSNTAMLEATFKGKNRYMMELEQTPKGPSHLTRITLFFVYQGAYFPKLHKDFTDKNETVALHAVIQSWPNNTLLKCNMTETYHLMNHKGDLSVNMTTFNLSLQAFNIKDNKPSKEETACGTAITTFAPSTTHHTTPSNHTNHTTHTTHTTHHTTPSNVTTVPPVTTTAMPSAPSTGTWNVTHKDGDNKTRVCMLMQMALRMIVTYEDTKNKSESVTVDLPVGAPTNEKKTVCNATYALLSLQLPHDMELDLYVDSDSDKKQFVNKIELHYNTSAHPFVDAKHPGMMLANSSDLDLFKSSKDNYYQCNSETDQTVMDVKFEFSDVKMQAGQNTTDTGFTGTDEECAADEKTNAIVPIAVGAALAGLVLIVVVAYLIGRRRRQSGYQSV